MPAAHPSFEFLRATPIASLRLTVEEYVHRVTGAQHFHLAAADPHNAFMVAFRTMPLDSTGVAHILEHTALCGSRRYPVRDPFFLMTRRSLNTFMNAFTSGDWTAYPFASLNAQDFDNLLGVYLDAAFFPTLDPLDFAQEGHRLEFAEPANPSSELVIKGVVYNEMKGALSAPVRSLWERLSFHLYPSVTYHYNSGGDPAEIPNLTHAQLVDFHRHHYHPSNAVFMTYGDVPAVHRQAQFETLALHAFPGRVERVQVPDERRYSAARAIEETYALEGDEDTAGKTHHVLGWLLGPSTDLDAVLEAHLLNGVLLDSSAAPLRHALETTGLGSAPSSLCGLEDSTREMSFVCGLEGSEPDHCDAVEALVLDVLREVAAQGVPDEITAAVLHQLELHQREIGGDHYPYGLQLMLNGLGAAIHGADPAAVLNLDPALDRLRAKASQPSYVPQLVRRLLLDNPHRVRLTYRPDPAQGTREAEALRAALAARSAHLDDAERARIVALAGALTKRQAEEPDVEVLPKVTLADVPADLAIPEAEAHDVSGCPTSFYGQGTNGLVYHELVLDLPALEPELLDALPYYALCLTEVGSAGRDYRQTQALQSLVTGGLHANTSLRGRVDSSERVGAYFILGGKALVRNADALADLLAETQRLPRFDEAQRLQELIAQARTHAEQAVTGNGHGLAMLAASAGLAPTAAMQHGWRGLAGLRALKHLDDTLDDDAALQALAGRLAALHTRLATAPRRLLLIAEPTQRPLVLEGAARAWAALDPARATPTLTPGWQARRVQEAWITNTQVQFCARAYPAPASGHPDAAPFMVLGAFLRNGFLHRAVREQGGAYGGGAGYDGDSGAFRFYSYRDPRLAGTLADFDAALDWLHSAPHTPRALEEAILGVVARIDTPGSPAGEAMSAFHAALHGRTPTHRRALRSRVLAVTLADLQRVADQYLQPARAHTAVICPPKARAEAERLGLHPEIL